MQNMARVAPLCASEKRPSAAGAMAAKRRRTQRVSGGAQDRASASSAIAAASLGACEAPAQPPSAPHAAAEMTADNQPAFSSAESLPRDSVLAAHETRLCQENGHALAMLLPGHSVAESCVIAHPDLVREWRMEDPENAQCAKLLPGSPAEPLSAQLVYADAQQSAYVGTPQPSLLMSDSLVARLSDESSGASAGASGAPLLFLDMIDSSEAEFLGSVFEDLAGMTSQGEVECLAGANSANVAPAAAKAAAVSVPVVGDLEMEEGTRQAVEKWLKDSPELHSCLAPATDPEDFDGQEGSLPQWVLEELGESAATHVGGESVRRRLVRMDSLGSSNNGPVSSRKAWGGEGAAEPSLMTEDGAGRQSECGECAVDSNLCVAEGGDEFETAEYPKTASAGVGPATMLSLSSVVGQNEHDALLADDADSAGCKLTSSMQQHMSRSFSTSWIRDLAEESEAFKEPLGAAVDASDWGHCAGYAGPKSVFELPEGVALDGYYPSTY